MSSLIQSLQASAVSYVPEGVANVVRTINDKVAERISLGDYATAGAIGQGNVNADTAAFLGAMAAVKQAYYDKGAVRLVLPVPAVPYRLNATWDATEVWNLSIVSDSAWGFQRQQVADPTTDTAMVEWYGAAGGVMMRMHYTFGARIECLGLNGRGLAKIGIAIAPAVSGPSVTREVELLGLNIKNCDFGLVVGDLAAQTDNAPINIVSAHISGCTSAAILVNSGNAAVEIVQAFLINNGYAPTKGNSFISDAANVGAHLNVQAGFVGVTGLTTDTDPQHLLAGAAICQGSGSLRVNGAWCDDPAKPFYMGFADRPVYFNGVNHYDASMTAASTPDSIQYNGPQILVLESCFLYGNVNITAGNQAGVIDLGTTFKRAGAGFVGNMVTQYGGLIRMGRTGNNSNALAVGGDFPTGTGGWHSLTAWSDHNAPGFIRAARNGGYKITEHINSVNGELYVLGNAYFDLNVGQYKAIAGGKCWRHQYGQGNEVFDSYTAGAAGEVITWANSHGFIKGVGANAIPIMTAGGQKMTWDSIAPTVGAWAKGDRVFNINANVGSPKGWICTVAGTPGTWVSEGNL